MNLTKTLYVTNRKQWRSWLKNNPKEKEIWLIYYKKSSKKPRIQYNDAVEEALCYGWIDSTMKSIDKNRFAQRFTPRKNKKISAMNQERVKKLIKQRKMTKKGLEAIELKETKLNKEILKEIKKNRKAWENFQKFPDHYKRIRIGYLEMQKRHSDESYRKALDHLIKMSEKNKKFGMMR